MSGGRKLRNHRGELSNRGAEGKAERFPHRGRVPTSTHQACLLTQRDGWGLKVQGQASEIRFQGENWCWLRKHRLKGASAPQLARRESGKKSGTA